MINRGVVVVRAYLHHLVNQVFRLFHFNYRGSKISGSRFGRLRDYSGNLQVRLYPFYQGVNYNPQRGNTYKWYDKVRQGVSPGSFDVGS